jgi:hypothetical protein
MLDKSTRTVYGEAMPVREHTAKAVIKITSTSHSQERAIRQFERFLASSSQWFVKVELMTDPEWETIEEEEDAEH